MLKNSPKKSEAARSDSQPPNGRNELLTAATLGAAAPYGYSYDNIGNRKTARNCRRTRLRGQRLNQYTGIEESGEAPLCRRTPSGNQTLIKTSTGVWTVEPTTRLTAR